MLKQQQQALKPLLQLQGTAAPLNRDNVDTDQVIPARFLKGTSKNGMGEALFYDLRLLPDGTPNLDFVLNEPKFAHACMLLAGENFGCGSSREHAPWALKAYGFQAVLAKSFADIFKNNSLKNGVLPIVLPAEVIDRAMALVHEAPSTVFHIDLPEQTVSLEPLGTFAFEIHPFWKKCLVEGVDQVGYTLSHLPAIEAFERKHEAAWAFTASLPAV